MYRRIKIVFIIITLGIVLRLLHWVLPFMDADMAVTGLMARHILEREFPVFFWNQNYCGAIEAYLAAFFFAIFGASRYTLNAVPVLESVLFMLLMYVMAKRIFGRKIGLLTLLFTAIPARYLIVNTVLARANYVENLVLGAVVFYLTYRIVYEEEGLNSHKLFFALGVIYGLAWWTSFQSVYYILTSFFFIFLRKKLIFFSRRFLGLLSGIFIGGSPFWYYCFSNGLGSFNSLVEKGLTNVGWSMKSFFLFRLPTIFGMIKSQSLKVYIPGFSHLLLFIYIAAFLYILKERFRGLLYLGKFSLKRSNGMEMFIVFFFVFAVIYLFSGYGYINTSRYLVILYLCMPLFLAYFIAQVGEKHRKLSFCILGIILAANIQQNIVSIDLFNKKKRQAFFQNRENRKELFGFLRGRGIKYVYVNSYWRNYNCTFDAGETIIFTEWDPSRYPAYFEEACKSREAAFYIPGDDKVLMQMLKNIGVKSYKRKLIARGTLYYDFEPLRKNWKEINITGAKVTTNYNQNEANYALDGDLTTRWTTETPQVPGMCFQLDLGEVKEICRIILELNHSFDDYPRGYTLSVSLDGKNWRDIVVSEINWGAFYRGKFHPVMDEKEAKFEICFEPHLVRFIRLEQSGRNDVYWWSINEFKLYSPSAYLTDYEEEESCKVEKVNFKSDNLNLAGYIYRLPKLNCSWPLPVIVLSHGSNPNGQLKFFYQELAKRFTLKGYLVFTFDYRGFGESDDPPDIAEAKSFNWKQDLKCAIAYMRKRYQVEELTIVGHSFGAALTLAVGSEGKLKADRIVVISPPRRMNELFFEENPVLGLEWLQERIKKDMKLKDSLPRGILAEIHEPIILENFRGWHFSVPVLFVDEGNAVKEDISFLTNFCESISGDITRITIPDTEHYFAAGDSLQIKEAMQQLVKAIDSWIIRRRI